MCVCVVFLQSNYLDLGLKMIPNSEYHQFPFENGVLKWLVFGIPYLQAKAICRADDMNILGPLWKKNTEHLLYTGAFKENHGESFASNQFRSTTWESM